MLGPIFWLEVVTSGRRARYVVARVLYALVLLVTLWMATSAVPGAAGGGAIHGAANVARDFFTAFAYVQLVALLLLAPAMTAGTIASEHERRTIEYLFTSQLSVAEIVLGKLSARLLHVVFVLLAGVPVLALASLMGGIPPASIAIVTYFTGLTLLAVVSLSLAISVRTRRSREAVVRAYVVLAALLVVPPIVSLLCLAWATTAGHPHLATTMRDVVESLLAYHPFVVMSRVFETSLVSSLAADLWHVTLAYVGFSLVCVLSALYGVRRTYLKAAGAGAKHQRRWQWRRRPAIGHWGMLWKELVVERAAVRLGLLGRLALGALVATVLSPLLLGDWSARMFHDYLQVAGAMLGVLMLLLIAARSAASITSEKERDCWTTLLTTNFTPAEIVGAKLLGNLYAVRWLGYLLCGLWLVQALLEPRYWQIMPVLFGTYLLLACWAGMLGLVSSLKCKTSVWAMVSAVGMGTFIGGGYLFCCCLPIMAWSRDDLTKALGLAPCVPFLLGVAAELPSEMRGSGYERGAQIFGLVGYALATALLWGFSVGDFDRTNGRIHAGMTPPQEKQTPATSAVS